MLCAVPQRLLGRKLVQLLQRQKKGNILCSQRKSSKNATILGIETSCDDTGCAIVTEEGRVLGESLKSQGSLHVEFGGIMPPMANMFHKENIDSVVNEALSRAGLSLDSVDAIATTVKPGLALSLIVGMEKGKVLSRQSLKPFIPIHHMEAHALTIRMVDRVEFPFLVLLISGGHCLLSVAQDIDKFLLLGSTMDDAPGEALDKIARRLKLSHQDDFVGLCGGEAIERAAAKGDPEKYPVSEPLNQNKDCNFSFAGIKNSARRIIVEEEETFQVEGDELIPNVNDFCASVQYAVIKHLCRRAQRAMDYAKEQKLLPTDRLQMVVSGGVAANRTIGRALRALCESNSFTLHVAPPKLCTDNGVMIAWNGVERFLLNRGVFPHNSLHDIDIVPKCPFGEDISDKVTLAQVKGRRLPWKEILGSL